MEGLEPAALQAVVNYGWPGNVRELDHAIERAVLMAQGDRIEARESWLECATGAARASTR